MSKIDEFISNIDHKKRTIKRDEFYNFIEESLRQVGEINEAYKKLYEGLGEEPAILASIEKKYGKIKENYDDLFLTDSEGKIKSAELQNKINEIKKYHKELIEGSGEEDSIHASIEDSEKYITNFYNFLFDKDKGEGGVSNEEKTKKCIKEISDFYEKLSNTESGIKKEIEEAHQDILGSHNDLYEKDEKGNNKIIQLGKNIEEVNAFKDKIDSNINPFLDNIKDDISTKQKDINALLEGATGGSLMEGFLQSKNEYNQIPAYKKIEGNFSKKVVAVITNFLKYIANTITIWFDYVLFIFPLIISVAIFVDPGMMKSIFNQGGNIIDTDITNLLSKLNFLSRLTISLPLWWISWFGQRNISHKKRLAEEYNHKAQITKMYLNFSARKTHETYPITKEAKDQLDEELIKAIKRHPGEVYGKDETMVDKIIQSIKAFRGVGDEDNEQKDNDSESDK